MVGVELHSTAQTRAVRQRVCATGRQERGVVHLKIILEIEEYRVRYRIPEISGKAVE